MKKSNLLDTILGKAISRKLFAFGLASCFLGFGMLDSDNWTLLACIYIGAQGAIDFYQVSRGMQPITKKDDE